MGNNIRGSFIGETGGRQIWENGGPEGCENLFGACSMHNEAEDKKGTFFHAGDQFMLFICTTSGSKQNNSQKCVCFLLLKSKACSELVALFRSRRCVAKKTKERKKFQMWDPFGNQLAGVDVFCMYFDAYLMHLGRPLRACYTEFVKQTA